MANYVVPDIKIAKEVKNALGTLGSATEDKDFWGFVKGLPSMIVQEGILQSLAFMKAKKDKKYHQVFNAFNSYAGDLLNIRDNNFNLIKYLIDQSIELEKYMYLENQMLQYAMWFKRIGLALYAPEDCK
ncbi:type III-B CRISPR module-associated protein Cmr5 [Calditrichota bacterium LG25]